MKTLALQAHERNQFGKRATLHVRKKGYLPGVLYGGSQQAMHFYVPIDAVKPLIYTPDVHFIKLGIGDQKYDCILQDLQVHPVNDLPLHMDLLRISADKPIERMEIPIVFKGDSPGVAQGGLLVKKRNTLSIKALPKDMPSEIETPVAHLHLGKIVRVEDIKTQNYQILNKPRTLLGIVETPRALRSKANQKENPNEKTD